MTIVTTSEFRANQGRYLGMVDNGERVILKSRRGSYRLSPIGFKRIPSKAQSSGIRKIRMPIASKGRGKAGSARVITANAIIAEHEGRIALLTIYDKSDYTTVDVKVIRQMARELGFEV